MQKLIGLFGGKKPEGAMTETVNLDTIIIDNALNPRDGALDQEAILDYSAHLDDLPAMHVFRIPAQGDNLYLVSGFHRIAAHRLAGRTEAPFIVHFGTMAEAAEFADLDNLTHGLRLTRLERRAVIARQLRRHPEWSDGWLASACYTTDKTVRSVREELEAAGEIERLDRLIGTDGIERPRSAPRPAAAAEAGQQVTFVESPADVAPVLLRPVEEMEETAGEQGSRGAGEKLTQAEVNARVQGSGITEDDPGEVYDPDAAPPVRMAAPELAPGEAAEPPPPPTPEIPGSTQPPPPAPLPPPVIRPAPWAVSVSVLDGAPALVTIVHGSATPARLPAEVAARVIAAVEARVEPEAVAVVEAAETATEWLEE